MTDKKLELMDRIIKEACKGALTGALTGAASFMIKEGVEALSQKLETLKKEPTVDVE